MSWLLRHGLHKEGLTDCVRTDGFVPVSRVLPCLGHGVDVAAVRREVETNDKQRFALLEEDGVLFVRANQGHTVARGLDDDAMLEVLTAETAPATVVHGTYRHAWPAIRETGLNRMKRRHVHFATAVDPSRVVSGMRQSAQVLIYLDAPRAIDAGLKLYRSANGVILCPGFEDGGIPAAFFSSVVDAETGAEMMMGSSEWAN